MHTLPVGTARRITVALFLTLLWLAVMLLGIVVHELGHALAAPAGGWHNSISFFGGTTYFEPAFWQAVADHLATAGIPPETWGQADNLTLVTALAQQMPVMRYGVLGGWVAQLVSAAVAAVLFRLRAFRDEASAYARLFWGVYIVSTLAWVGAIWLGVGLLTPRSTDAVVLQEVILQGSWLAIAVVWMLGITLVGLSVLFAARYGDRFFAFAIPDRGSHLARLWALLIVCSALIGKFPLPALIEGLAGPLLILVGTAIYLTRQHTAYVPAIGWLNTSAILAVIVGMLITRSGIIVGSDSDTLSLHTIQALYCEQGECLPADIAKWFR